MHVGNATLALLDEKQKQLRQTLDKRVFPLLERWCAHAVKVQNISLACVIHAHLAFLYKNVLPEELDTRIVSTLLCAQIFLTTRHHFDTDAEGKAKREKTKAANERDLENEDEKELGVSDTELFDMFQKHRSKIFRWIKAYPAGANECFEAVVRVATFTGSRARPKDAPANRQWKALTYRNCDGRFIPDDGKDDNPVPEPDGENESYESWMRRAQRAQRVLDTEINIQLGDFTLKTSRLQLLDRKIMQMYDFKAVFGECKNDSIQCAEVKNTQHREWVRLVGRRHDTLLWTPDMRKPCLPSNFTRSYSPGSLWKSERCVRARVCVCVCVVCVCVCV